jgi:hypothetical protein
MNPPINVSTDFNPSADIISIGLDQASFEVNEALGFLEVCVQVLSENITLARPVSVNITTLALTAEGT